MNTELLKLYPHDLWENFAHLCDAPRPSKHEEAALAWMKSWAREHEVDVRQDATGNLLFTIPATKGMEKKTPVIMQAHCDMVPQANSDKKHDFLTDPIEPVIGADGWVRANGTTLGADDGIGVCAALACVTTPGCEHGPIEILVTVDEETGMTGAFGLKKGFVKGKILLNLDSETEGEMYVGCAGGLDANFSADYKTVPVPAGHVGYELTVGGLKGGHSGMDIHLGRANANKLAVRFLYKAVNRFGACLANAKGGTLRNAIPREARALMTVPADKAKDFEALAEQTAKTLKEEFGHVEPDMVFKVTKTETPKEVMETRAQNSLIGLLFALPHGILRMSDAFPNLVETSNNIAAFTAEDGKMTVLCLLRSSVDTAKEAAGDRFTAIAGMAGFDLELTGGYPGWKPNLDSPILKVCKETYRQTFGTEAKIMAIHAGLECALFVENYDWDMASFGPTIEHPHSPDERVNIESVGKFFDFLTAILKNVPEE